MPRKNFMGFGDAETIFAGYAQDIKGRLKKVIAMPTSPTDKETVLYTGTTTSQYIKGGIYEYAEGAEMPLFAWTETDTIYTEIETPSVGDSVYDSEGAEIGTIEAIDTGKITVDTTEYARNTESDTTITVGRGWDPISTSDLSAGDGIIIDGGVISSDSPIFYETETDRWEDLTDEQKSHYKYVVNDKDGTTYLVAEEVTRTGQTPVESQAIFLFALQKVTTMPQNPHENDFVVYIGDDTYAYNEVTPTGNENPQELGWYESDGTDYTLSTDTEVTTGKTYYEREKALIQGGIYRYNGTTWELKSATGDIEIKIDSKQDKTLETPLTIGGTERATVEGALGALNDGKADVADLVKRDIDTTYSATKNLDFNDFKGETNTKKSYWLRYGDTWENCPTSTFGTIDWILFDVENIANRVQQTILIQKTTNRTERWTRAFVYADPTSGTTWSNWVKIATSTDISAIQDVIPSNASENNQLVAKNDIYTTTAFIAANNAVTYRKVDIKLLSVSGVVQLITKSGDVYYISKRDGTSIKFTKVVNGVGGDVVTLSGYAFDATESVLTLYLTMSAWSSIRIDVLNAWSKTGQNGTEITVTVIEQSELSGTVPTIINVIAFSTLTATYNKASGLKSGSVTISSCKQIGENLALVSGYIAKNSVLTITEYQCNIGNLAISGKTALGTNPTSLFIWSQGQTPQCVSCTWKTTGGWLAVPWDSGDKTVSEDAWFNAVVRYQ